MLVSGANSTLFRVSPVGGDPSGSTHAFVCQVVASEGNMVMEFTSIYRVTNNLDDPIALYTKTGDQVLSLVPGRSGYLPMKAIYGRHSDLFVKIADGKYEASLSPVNLKLKKKPVVVTCPALEEEKAPLIFSTFIDVVQVDPEKQSNDGFILDKEDTFHLKISPLVTFKNLLPFDIQVADMVS